MIEPARLAGGAVLRSQSDERLVDLVRAGNDRAFEAIVHRYRRALLRYCGRFLTGARAEDAVQQAFMNAYQAIKSDERPIDLRPWLYRIAHNTSLNVLRAAVAAREEPITDDIDGVERPDQAVERRQSLAEVVAAVQALPPRQRDALILHELEGRTYEQIAAELKISGGAVRQLLSRARTTLRSGATAVVPEWLLVRLASSSSEPTAARVAELVLTGGGAAVAAKVGTAVVVAGAVAIGAAEGPVDVTGDDERKGKGKRQAVAVSASATGAGPGGSLNGAGATATGDERGEAGDRRERAEARERGERRRGRGRGDHDQREGDSSRTDDDERSGNDSGSDDSGGESGEDRSGSNSGSDGGSNSGPGGESDDGEPDSSGPGDGTLVTETDDNSGSDSSGSGSSGSGSDDGLVLTAPDSDSSGPGSGSDDD